MEEIIRFISGLVLLIIGIGGCIGTITFAPGHTKIAGVPIGIVFVTWGLAVLGWI